MHMDLCTRAYSTVQQLLCHGGCCELILSLARTSVGNPHPAVIDDDRNDSVCVCVHVWCTHGCESMCVCSLFSYGGVGYTYLQHSPTHTNT